MRINRAIGLLLFLLIAKFLLSDMIESFTAASSAVFGAIEAAAVRTQATVQ